ncbi:hypothetical protein THRCLA_03438 [Thraustotheca clavata]|uniref:Transmembrane protein n=1 Tax=Thraustotheca clavata TaxID=74557 RepID=A0A1W0A203_9STRA|nr:hypothetical protein THRCLA_03438 [Thraustotheca clavata]
MQSPSSSFVPVWTSESSNVLNQEIILRRIRIETVIPVDIETLILQGIGECDSVLTLADSFDKSKTRRSYENQLKKMIAQVNMNKFTLRFSKKYEVVFAYMLHRSAIRRIRYTLVIALVTLVGKNIYSLRNNLLTANQVMGLQIGAGTAFPTLVIAFFCTLRESWTPYCEWYTSLAFIVICTELTVQKLVLQSPGPILELFVCFIPIFGITRLRFDISWRVVACSIVAHLLALFVARQENLPDICFQGFSYLGGIIGGAVAHYRVEVLRRRNYMMYLPFCPESFDRHRIFCDIKEPSTSKHQLLNSRISLKFRNREIEAAFYRYWYLIDGSPFEPIHTQRLHRKAFRAIRYAVQSVLLQQLLLGIQDRRYLTTKDVQPWTYWAALVLRLSIVAAYFGAQWCMRKFGRKYYLKWEEMQSSTQIVCLEENPALLEPKVPQNYVKIMQRLSAWIVFMHGLGMGLILLFFHLSIQRSTVAAPCYYLGLLNAILFPHRSGFRVRFIYATIATVSLGIVFCSICIWIAPKNFLEYSTYVVVILLLGMLISHEEESLRRAFFVRRALRSQEFNTWHKAVQTIAPYIHRKLVARRRRNKLLLNIVPRLPAEPSDIMKDARKNKIPTCNLLATASKYGMYSDACQAIVAAIILSASA